MMRYLTEVTFRSKMELVLEGLGTTVYRYMHEIFACNDQMQACHRVGVCCSSVAREDLR